MIPSTPIDGANVPPNDTNVPLGIVATNNIQRPINPIPEQEIKHMEMIQGVINRFAGNSAKCKEMCITITSAILVLATTNKTPDTLLIALGAIVLFWFLDSYYLGLERTAVRLSIASQEKIANNTFSYSDLYKIPIGGKGIEGFLKALNGFKSWSTTPVYLLMLGGLFALKLYYINPKPVESTIQTVSPIGKVDESIKIKSKKLFISYAKEDSAYYEDLVKQMGTLINQGKIELFSDKKILQNEGWDKQLMDELQKSDAIVYLVSKNSLDAKKKYIHMEMEKAKLLNTTNHISIFPVLLEKDCLWQHSPLKDYNFLPDKKSINSYPTKAEGFTIVAEKLINELNILK
jgi:TIR domain